MIAALAGRRVDAADAKEPHFPADRVDVVERRIRARLEEDGVRVLVCAAACGADLLALSAAAQLGIERTIVLPFTVESFKERSVVDRPGPFPWGDLYDRFVKDAIASGELDLLGLDPNDPGAFEKANEAILDRALAIAKARKDEAEALVVWDSRLRTAHDYTEHFRRLAEERSITVKSIAILGRL